MNILTLKLTQKTVFTATFFLVILLVSSTYSAQVHPRLESDFTGTIPVWITFTDKGLSSAAARNTARDEARTWISTLASERRAARATVRPELTERDYPVNERYIRSVLAVGVKKRAVSRWLNTLTVEATGEQIKKISGFSYVKSIEPISKNRRDKNESVIIPAPPRKDSGKRSPDAINYGNSLDQLTQINVVAAHTAGYDGTGVVVGIMDTGFFKGHETLSGLTLLNEWDFVMDDGDVERDLGDPSDYSDFHGTAVWSVLGGYLDGQLVGPAYNAAFLLAKTEDERSETPVEEDYWVAGIEWMEANGADVVNSSLGYRTFDGGVGDYTYSDLDGNTAKTTIAADIAASLGVVVCNSAGNGGSASGSISAPADADDIISCGAVDIWGDMPAFSSRGPTYDGRIKPEVCAMGVYNWLANNNRLGNVYGNGNGTSFSSPLVAGAAALVLQAHPTWNPAMVREAFMETADNSGTPDNDFGWGVIDVMAAIGFVPTDVKNWDSDYK